MPSWSRPTPPKYPGGSDQVLRSVRPAYGDRHARVVLAQRGHGVAEPQVSASLLAHMLAQDFLDNRLRHLLAGLGEQRAALRRQAERAVEIGDPAAGQ